MDVPSAGVTLPEVRREPVKRFREVPGVPQIGLVPMRMAYRIIGISVVPVLERVLKIE